MKKVNPITKEIILERNKLSSKINDRINYITKNIQAVFKQKGYVYLELDIKCRDMLEELEETDFYYLGGELYVHFLPGLDNYDNFIILNDGADFDITTAFPIRWLFEDFEKELKDGRREYLKSQNKVEKDKVSILNNIKSKLTIEELKVLNLK